MTENSGPPCFIACASPKGGSGKTMTTILLACEFAALGHEVLILDTDIQGSAIGWFAASKAAKFPLHHIHAEAVPDKERIASRLRGLAQDNEGFEIVLIDVQGSADAVLSMAVVNADLVLIPTRIHKFDVDQAIKLVGFIESMGARGRRIDYRVLLNAVNAIDRNGVAYKTAQLILANAKLARLDTELSLRPTFATVATAGSLYEVAEPNKAVLDARNATRALLTEIVAVLNAQEEGVAA